MGDSGAKLGVALVGAGGVAQRHLAAWAARKDVELVAVIDTSSERARQVQEQWGFRSFGVDHQELVQRSDVHVVSVCVPPALHVTITRDLLAGDKHVLLEKPMATNLMDGRALVAATEGSNARVMIAENWPFASATRQVDELIEAGALGELFMLKSRHESGLYLDPDHRTRYPWAHQQEGGGYLFRAGIHNLVLAEHFLGETTSIYAVRNELPAEPGDRYRVECDVALTSRYASGALGVMSFTGRSAHVGPRRMTCTLLGSTGMASFDLLTGEVTHARAGVEHVVRESSPSLGYAEEIEHLVRCVREEEEPSTSPRRQLRSIALATAAYESMRLGVPSRPDAFLAGETSGAVSPAPLREDRS